MTQAPSKGPKPTEAEFQKSVIGAATALGWKWQIPMNSTNCDILTSTKYANAPAVLVTPRGVTQEVSAPMRDKSIPKPINESITEVWRPVVGYEGVYSVSNFGRVRRDLAGKGATAGYILKNRPAANGYPRVGLVVEGAQKTRHCHSLVAEAFLGPLLPGMCVNHIDGDKTNNCLSNLEYVSYSQNNTHAFRAGLKMPSSATGESNRLAKLTEADVRAIRYGSGSIAEKSVRFNVSKTHIKRIRNGKVWKHLDSKMES